MCALACLAFSPTALASWAAGGHGAGTARALALPDGPAPQAAAANRSVDVSWTPVTLPGGAATGGYSVRRARPDEMPVPATGDCAGTVTTTSCREDDVPVGDWTYSVATHLAAWDGAYGEPSSPVTVAPPALALDSAYVTTLDRPLTAALSGFASAQTVALRLDDPASGAPLAGEISPSPTASASPSSVSLTLPAATPSGAHTVYAVGSGGETASAPIRVAPLVTSGWDVRDASGGSEVDVSAADAFAGDGLTFLTGAAPTSFQPARFEEYAPNASLPPGQPVSGAEFDLRLGSGGAGQACFHLETRRASNGAVLAAHGSAAAPAGCASALQTFAVPLPEVTDSDLAGDLWIRAYVRDSGGSAVRVDQAVVSGTIPGRAFSLYDERLTDAASGATTSVPWPLATPADGAHQVSQSGWATSFSSSRYLKVRFPSYLPLGATIDSVTLATAYRPHSTGSTCLKVESWDGTTLLGTHGTGASPVSCTSSATSFQADSIALPEVSTRAQVNNLVMRLYLRNADGLKSDLDLMRLTVNYTL
jgi:hypothetical protein